MGFTIESAQGPAQAGAGGQPLPLPGGCRRTPAGGTQTRRGQYPLEIPWS